ncbi:MAG: flap endonuclease-1 [Acholeplasmataceae bacterium]
MGVKFTDIIETEEIGFKDLEGHSVAIDTYNTLYQFLSGIRQRDGTPLMDQDGNITSHLSGLLYRTSSIVEKGIKPIYVFDGKHSDFKTNTVMKRKEVRNESEKKWKEALDEGDEEKAHKFAMRSSKISPYIIESSKKLLDLLGIPYVQSKSEGEAQASYMVQKGDAWSVASQDYDCLLFGASRTVRNLTLSGGLSNLKYMELEKILANLDLTRNQLIDIAILVGTDFNEGIKGIGAKTGLKLIRNDSLENILKNKGVELEVEPDILRNIFLKPEVNTNYEIKWKNVKLDQLTEFMCEEHGFSEARVVSSANKMKKLNSTQKSLEDWF